MVLPSCPSHWIQDKLNLRTVLGILSKWNASARNWTSSPWSLSLQPSHCTDTATQVPLTSTKSCTGKVVSVHAMKAYRWSRGTASLINTEMVNFMHWSLYSQQRTLLPMWVLQVVWTFAEEKNLVPSRIQIPYHLAHSLITLLTMLSQLTFYRPVFTYTNTHRKKP